MCDYQGYEFGAGYPDSVCIDGNLWDADSGFGADDGWVYTDGGDIPCPMCDREGAIKWWYEQHENSCGGEVENPNWDEINAGHMRRAINLVDDIRKNRGMPPNKLLGHQS